MRRIRADGLCLIKQFEGFSARPYWDAAGLPTIGYGHLLQPGELEIWQNGLSEAQATRLLAQDVRLAERAVLRLIDVPLTDGQFDALVSFTYNAGAGALQRSTLRRKVNRGNHDEVPSEFMRWVWAGGCKLRGLVRRRAAEAALYVG